LRTITEVAEYFKTSRQNIHNKIKQGKIKTVPFGDLVRIPDDEFERLKREGIKKD
jgi:excisionase family DNA binding protein